MASANEKLAWFLMLISMANIADTQTIRPYVSITYLKMFMIYKSHFRKKIARMKGTATKILHSGILKNNVGVTDEA